MISRKEAARQGLRYFFTGIPCRHGHIAERYVSQCSCRECLKLSRSGELPEVPVNPRPRGPGRRWVTTDYARLTQAQIDAWYALIRDIQPHGSRYKHHPLDDLPIVYQPPVRLKEHAT
jgi:hypothetical protein